MHAHRDVAVCSIGRNKLTAVLLLRQQRGHAAQPAQGLWNGRRGEGAQASVEPVAASALRRLSGSARILVSTARRGCHLALGERRALRLGIELDLDDDSGAIVAADVGEAAALLVAQAQPYAAAATEVAPPQLAGRPATGIVTCSPARR